MFEMIERVARAIDPGFWRVIAGQPSCDAIACAVEASLARARAAIEAMREPTKEMLALVNDEERSFYQELHDLADETTVADIWRTLIDTALKETTDV
jgi:hypothetical protein